MVFKVSFHEAVFKRIFVKNIHFLFLLTFSLFSVMLLLLFECFLFWHPKKEVYNSGDVNLCSIKTKASK